MGPRETLATLFYAVPTLTHENQHFVDNLHEEVGRCVGLDELLLVDPCQEKS
jgi:hypothetical protein